MSTDPFPLLVPNIPGGSGGQSPPPVGPGAARDDTVSPVCPGAARDDTASLILAQWFSPGYPVGAFACSHGLETAIAEGGVTDAASLGNWIASVLDHGAGRNDALLMSVAWRLGAAGRDGAPPSPPGGEGRGGGLALADLDALARALAPSAERLAETAATGAAFARTTGQVWGLALPEATYPVAVGAAAGMLALPLADTLRLSLLAFAANLVSVGVRLIPLGQTHGQQVLAALAPLALRIAAEAAAGDLDDLGGAALAADIQSMRHETLTVRIFRT
jgi:urease accessory protein